MAEDSNLPSTVVENEVVANGIEISIDDVVAAGVSRVERELNSRLDALDEDLRDVQKQLKGSLGLQQALAEAEAEKVFGERAKALTAAMAAFGRRCQSRYVYCPSQGQPTVGVCVADAAHPNVCLVEASQDYDSEEDRRLSESIATFKGRAGEIVEESHGLKRQLSKIDAYERQLRGRIAETRLSASDSGQKLLARLVGTDIEEELKLLPGRV